MATTTNFGWETPDDTDLVKDGALAMRTLGNAIDTSLVDLKGGTTGQVLSKTSNTDMDFTWVTSDDANAIQNAIVDAKGDLIAASAADTPARLAVGNNGETLVADSSTSTGLRWQAPVQQNPVLNSSFQIWQRGTSVALSGFANYGPDRWMIWDTSNSTGMTVSRQATNDTTNLANIQYCARFQRNSGQSTTSSKWLYQSFESINSIPFAGKTVTLSFYARAGANYSSSGNGLSVRLATGTGTDQNWNVTYTGNATPISETATLTSTWQRFSYTATIATTATELSTIFGYTSTGTAGANDYFEITGVQLEVGSVATPFRTYAATLAGELAACQRYYFRRTAGTAFGPVSSAGFTTSTTAALNLIQYPVKMRTTPTSVDYANIQITMPSAGTSATVTNLTLNQQNDEMANLSATATGLTSGVFEYLRGDNNVAGYIGLSAEL